MTPEQAADLRQYRRTEATIDVNEVHGPDRTLVYGYCRNYDTGEERTFTVHVYKRDGELHALTYSRNGDIHSHLHGESLPAKTMSPGKRAYPEATDYSFAVLMVQRDAPLCHTNFGAMGQHSGQFVGLTHDECVPALSPAH